jgi:hypothetical protein
VLPAGTNEIVVAEHGAEIVTSEMVLFEWLRDARHPKFREVQKLLTSSSRGVGTDVS